MRKLPLIFFLILTITGTAAAQNNTTTINFDSFQLSEFLRAIKNENYIEVNGSAEKEVTPDQIYVRISISENDTKGKTSLERMEQDMIARLKAIGIDTDKQLTIGDMSSDPKSVFLGRNTTRTSASYQLIVDSAATLGLVYQNLEAIGISNLNVIKVAYSRMGELTAELRGQAVLNAQTKAEQLAEPLELKVGRAVNIVDYNSEASPRYDSNILMFSRAGKADADYQTELDFRSIKVTYSVTVKFAIQ